MNGGNGQICAAVSAILETYPESGPEDIYKSFYQDRFGPRHILSDLKKAEACFYSELAETGSRGEYCIEICGTGTAFCRVNIDFAADGIVEPDFYFESFVSGAERALRPLNCGWPEEWRIVLDAYIGMKKDSCDIQRICYALAEAASVDRAVSHSGRYRDAYNPRYRIFRIDSTLVLKLACMGFRPAVCCV